MSKKCEDNNEPPKYIRVFLNGFMLSIVLFFTLTYFRNNGFVPFRYLFF